MNQQDDPQIPAHESRHDFTLTGAELTEIPNTFYRLEGRVDNGRLLGKRITHLFEGHDKRTPLEFAKALDAPFRAFGTPGDMVAWLQGRRFSARFSARIAVTKEVWDAEADLWYAADELPQAECKYRFRYRLFDFSTPQRRSKLSLASNFHQRRKRLENAHG